MFKNHFPSGHQKDPWICRMIEIKMSNLANHCFVHKAARLKLRSFLVESFIYMMYSVYLMAAF